MRVILASLIALLGSVTNGQGRENPKCILLIPEVSVPGDLCDFCGCCMPDRIYSDMNSLGNLEQNWFDPVEQQNYNSEGGNFVRLKGICIFEGSSVRVLLKELD